MLVRHLVKDRLEAPLQFRYADELVHRPSLHSTM
jgi:hypothetical protein